MLCEWAHTGREQLVNYGVVFARRLVGDRSSAAGCSGNHESPQYVFHQRRRTMSQQHAGIRRPRPGPGSRSTTSCLFVVTERSAPGSLRRR